jgi:hypothetical protein
MKIATFYTDGHEVEIHNSFWGVESVKVDGKTVASQYSTLGAKHSFMIESEERKDEYHVKFRIGFPAAIDIYKNDKPLFMSPRNIGWRFFFFGITFILFYELIRQFF